MSSAKNIEVVVVVEVDRAILGEDPALVADNEPCALNSSDQSMVPSLLASTLPKVAMAWPTLGP